MSFLDIKHRIALIAFGIFTFLALAFSLILPPFQGGDEYAHFMRAMAMAEGRSYTGVGSMSAVLFPTSYENWEKTFPLQGFGCGTYYPNDVCVKRPQFSLKKTKHWIRAGWAAKPKSWQSGWAAMASYPPFSHAWPALGVWLAKFVSHNVARWFFMARVCQALGISLLAWQAFRVVGPAQSYICALLFLPTMIGSAGSITADGMINVLSLIMVAETLRTLRYTGSPITRRDMIGIACANAVCFVKFGYLLLPILSLAAFIWARKPNRPQAIWMVGLYLLSATCSILWLTHGGAFQVNAGGESSVAKQADYILQHPFTFPVIMWNSIWDKADIYAGSLVGWRSWGFARTTDVQLLYLVILGISTWLSAREVAPGIPRILRIRIGILASVIGLVTACFIFGILYLDWTNIGADSVTGVQGRYFVPLLFMLIFPMLACIPGPRKVELEASLPATGIRAWIRDPWLYTGLCLALSLVILGETASFYYVADGFTP